MCFIRHRILLPGRNIPVIEHRAFPKLFGQAYVPFLVVFSVRRLPTNCEKGARQVLQDSSSRIFSMAPGPNSFNFHGSFQGSWGPYLLMGVAKIQCQTPRLKMKLMPSFGRTMKERWERTAEFNDRPSTHDATIVRANGRYNCFRQNVRSKYRMYFFKLHLLDEAKTLAPISPRCCDLSQGYHIRHNVPLRVFVSQGSPYYQAASARNLAFSQ